MFSGIFAGITWALETVVLSFALGSSPFISTPEAILLAPFVSTFLHDACSALFMLIFNIVKGEAASLAKTVRSKSFKWLILSSAIGGPVGMTGYVLAVKYMGASVGAVASAVYPAIGTLLAFIFLKERVRWYQWIFLILTLGGIYGLSYSPSASVINFGLGLLGVFMCAFGWGIEAVILAKCFKADSVKSSHVLLIRQTTSALIYGALLIPLLGGAKFTAGLVTETPKTLLIIAAAALFASVSYLFYYKAIAAVGASKAMALNITYTAWALLVSVIITKDTSLLSPLTFLCTFVVIICGIASATDFKSLFKER